MKLPNETLADRLAAEYALGTLTGRARQRFERWIETEPRIRAQVERWQLRLGRMADAEPDLAPPAALWRSLEQRLFATPAERTPPRWYQKLAPWRALAIGSSLAAAVLAAVLVVRPPAAGDVDASYIVLIQNRQQQPVWTASASSDFAQIKVRNLKPMDMPQNAGCLLWVQPAGSDEIYPLGLLPDDGGVTEISVGSTLRDKIMAGKLMVTVEDRAQPPQSPTGATEYTGRVVALESVSI